jgi:integrase
MSTYRLEEIKENTKYVIFLELGKVGSKRIRPKKVFYGTERKAHAEARRWLAEEESRSLVEPTKTKLKDYLDSWLEDWKAENNLSPGSYRAYKSRIANQINKEIGETYLAKLEPLHINQLRNALLKRGLTPSTVKNTMSLLNTALEYAFGFKMIRENPMQYLKQSGAGKAKKRNQGMDRQKVKALEKKELENLFKKMEGHYLYPMVYTAAFTGMRVGELCGLTWDEVVFSGNKSYLKVRQQVKLDKNEEWNRGETKSANSVRDVGIDAGLADFLKEIKSKSTCKYVFENKGCFYKPNQVSDRFGKLMIKLGIGDINFHMLRHTHASLLLAAGSPITDVAARLGDTVAEVQKTYAHFMPSRIHEPAKVFSSIMVTRPVTQKSKSR